MFVEVYRRKLKDNTGKNKVLIINGEEGLECEVHIEGICLEDVFWMKQLRMGPNVVGK